MPIYNTNHDELRVAIESILNQTFTDFEFIIINDGSTNGVEDVILSYKDERIKYYKNETNMKIIATLNRGLELAQGKYIARLDGDDYNTPDRLEKQFNHMEAHPEVGVLGTFFTRVPTNVKIELPYTQKDAKICMRYVRGCILHSSAMIRKSVLDEHNLKYDICCLHAEDHKLWSDMSRFCEIEVLPEFLTYHRVSPEGISQQNAIWQQKMVCLIFMENIIRDFAADKQYMYDILRKYVTDTPISMKEFLSIKSLFEQVCVHLSNEISEPHKEMVPNFIMQMLTGFLITKDFK